MKNSAINLFLSLVIILCGVVAIPCHLIGNATHTHKFTDIPSYPFRKVIQWAATQQVKRILARFGNET